MRISRSRLILTISTLFALPAPAWAARDCKTHPWECKEMANFTVGVDGHISSGSRDQDASAGVGLHAGALVIRRSNLGAIINFEGGSTVDFGDNGYESFDTKIAAGVKGGSGLAKQNSLYVMPMYQMHLWDDRKEPNNGTTANTLGLETGVAVINIPERLNAIVGVNFGWGHGTVAGGNQVSVDGSGLRARVYSKRIQVTGEWEQRRFQDDKKTVEDFRQLEAVLPIKGPFSLLTAISQRSTRPTTADADPTLATSRTTLKVGAKVGSAF